MNETTSKPHDPKNSLQAFLLLDGLVRLFIWSNSIALTMVVFQAVDTWPEHAAFGAEAAAAWQWAGKIMHAIVLFNLFYVAHLVALRMLIPTPKEGRYRTGPGSRLDRQLIYSALIATLTKARYEAPFPAFLVFHIANLPPMRWLMNPVFGPRSRSCHVTEPGIIDPHLVTVGRNVVIGFGTVIGGHYQESDAVTIRRTVIEDDVLIGACVAMSGVHVHRGAVIAAGSIILPGSVIGENEYWSGNPARRRRTLPPVGRRHGHQTGPQVSPAGLEREQAQR